MCSSSFSPHYSNVHSAITFLYSLIGMNKAINDLSYSNSYKGLSIPPSEPKGVSGRYLRVLENLRAKFPPRSLNVRLFFVDDIGDLLIDRRF